MYIYKLCYNKYVVNLYLKVKEELIRVNYSILFNIDIRIIKYFFDSSWINGM